MEIEAQGESRPWFVSLQPGGEALGAHTFTQSICSAVHWKMWAAGGGAPHRTIHTQKWGREDPSQGPPLPSKAKWTEKWESIPLSKTWCPFPDSILPPTAANLQGIAAVFSH